MDDVALSEQIYTSCRSLSVIHTGVGRSEGRGIRRAPRTQSCHHLHRVEKKFTAKHSECSSQAPIVWNCRNARVNLYQKQSCRFGKTLTEEETKFMSDLVQKYLSWERTHFEVENFIHIVIMLLTEKSLERSPGSDHKVHMHANMPTCGHYLDSDTRNRPLVAH